MFIGSRHSARFISHLVVRTHPDVSIHHYIEQVSVLKFSSSFSNHFSFSHFLLLFKLVRRRRQTQTPNWFPVWGEEVTVLSEHQKNLQTGVGGSMVVCDSGPAF